MDLFMFVQKISGGRERRGWNFKSTCALRRPNPGGPGTGSGAPAFPYAFFSPLYPPHAQSSYHGVQFTHLTDVLLRDPVPALSPLPLAWPVSPIQGWTEVTPQSSPLLLTPLRGPPPALTRNGGLGQAYCCPLPPLVAKKNPCPQPFLLGPHGSYPENS